MAVTSVSPNARPTGGGKTVTITVMDFTGATKVAFGTTPAASFTVACDTKITAVTPGHAAATVYVFVTTPVGRSAVVTADHDTYT